jgi:hypothetical protein
MPIPIYRDPIVGMAPTVAGWYPPLSPFVSGKRDEAERVQKQALAFAYSVDLFKMVEKLLADPEGNREDAERLIAEIRSQHGHQEAVTT